MISVGAAACSRPTACPSSCNVNAPTLSPATAPCGIVAAALASWLSPDAADQREAAMAKRLDRLSRQFERLERDQSIQIETLALFVRYFLTVSTPVPEAHQDAARAQGKARFAQFIEQLGRHLLRGHSLVRELVEEIQPDTVRRDAAAGYADAQAPAETS